MRSVEARYAGWCGIVALAAGTGGGAGAGGCFGYVGRVRAAAVAMGTLPVFALRGDKSKTHSETQGRVSQSDPHENDSRGEVTGTGGKRVHDFGGVGSSHPRHKRRSALLCHLVFTSERQKSLKSEETSLTTHRWIVTCFTISLL